jgi:DNA modification methylase
MFELICGDNTEILKDFPESCIDLTVTSPPYDDLRKYKGYEFQVEPTAEQLFRVTKDGGVVVWVVSDKTVDGSETGSSFVHALTFKSAGFNLHDTMIWKKPNPTPSDGRIPRYVQSFEYMFVFSKGKPKTFNGVRVPTKNSGKSARACNNYPARRENGEKSFQRTRSLTPEVLDTRIIHNVVEIPVNSGKGDGIAIKHPAPFPERLAEFHVLSWSNPGDIVLDPFCGSGTTGKMALRHGRAFIGIDVSREYLDEIARPRLTAEMGSSI